MHVPWCCWSRDSSWDRMTQTHSYRWCIAPSMVPRRTSQRPSASIASPTPPECRSRRSHRPSRHAAATPEAASCCCPAPMHSLQGCKKLDTRQNLAPRKLGRWLIERAADRTGSEYLRVLSKPKTPTKGTGTMAQPVQTFT